MALRMVLNETLVYLRYLERRGEVTKVEEGDGVDRFGAC